MAIADHEREMFGEALEPLERAVGGVVVATGAVGHAALIAAALTLLYVVLFVA